MSQYIGVGICCLTFSLAYFNNVWNAQNFPFLSQSLFNLDGTIYNQSSILNADNSLNQTLLDAVGLPWYSTTNAIYYLGSNLGSSLLPGSEHH